MRQGNSHGLPLHRYGKSCGGTERRSQNKATVQPWRTPLLHHRGVTSVLGNCRSSDLGSDMKRPTSRCSTPATMSLRFKWGRTHFKPQKFAGTLLASGHWRGAASARGSRPNRRKNQVEGLCRVPKALCLEYAKLLIAHLKLMGKEEFLAYRMKALKAELPTGPKVTYPKGKPEGSKHSEAEQVSTESSSSARASSSTPRPMEWSEGYGKYGMLKPSLAADQDPAKEVYVGGLRGTLSVDGRIIQTLVIQ